MPKIIYGIAAPNSANVVYVGQTTNSRSRLKAHIGCSSNKRLRLWLQDLAARGFDPHMRVLERVKADADINERERYWIRRLAQSGHRLFNDTGLVKPKNSHHRKLVLTALDTSTLAISG